MKIDELVKKVNSYFWNLKAIKRDDGILIISSNDDALLLVPEKATNFMEVYFYVDNQGMYFATANREKLSALIEEFLETPIDERFSEKKYRLRWFKDLNGASNCLNYIDGEWTCSDIHYANQYSQRELEKLKKENPRLATAIDAMKEPVEDSEDED